jgi:glutathione S-transferase
MKLYTFFRSSASFRVRIALNTKGLKYEPALVSLPKGEHLEAKYKSVNSQGLVPALEDAGHILTQSLAIIE